MPAILPPGIAAHRGRAGASSLLPLAGRPAVAHGGGVTAGRRSGPLRGPRTTRPGAPGIFVGPRALALLSAVSGADHHRRRDRACASRRAPRSPRCAPPPRARTPRPRRRAVAVSRALAAPPLAGGDPRPGHRAGPALALDPRPGARPRRAPRTPTPPRTD